MLAMAPENPCFFLFLTLQFHGLPVLWVSQVSNCIINALSNASKRHKLLKRRMSSRQRSTYTMGTQSTTVWIPNTHCAQPQ